MRKLSQPRTSQVVSHALTAGRPDTGVRRHARSLKFGSLIAVCMLALLVGDARAQFPPQESVLGYSVAIASHGTLDEARARQRDLAWLEDPVYIVPVTVRGSTWYRVLAGMLQTEGEARFLMQRLVDRGVKESANNWDVRPTRFVFGFGLQASEEEAQATVSALQVQGIGAYAVPAGVGGNADSHYVYAGGFENADEGRVLEGQVRAAGFSAVLVERIGLTPEEAQRRRELAAETPPPPVVPLEQEPPAAVEPEAVVPAVVVPVAVADEPPVEQPPAFQPPPPSRARDRATLELGVDIAVAVTSIDDADETLTNVEIPLQRLRIGIYFSDRIALEPSLSLAFESFGDEEETDLTLALAALYHFGGDLQRTRFFLELGGLANFFDDGIVSTSQAGIAGGGGLKLPAAEGFLAFRFEFLVTRLFGTEDRSAFTTFVIGTGISVFP